MKNYDEIFVLMLVRTYLTTGEGNMLKLNQ